MNDKLKTYLGWVIILVLLILAYSTVVYVSSYAETTEPSSFRSFGVTAEGKVMAVPDIAEFSFSVITDGGPQIGNLQQQNTDKMNKAIEYVKSNSIEAKDIKTQQYNLQPRYRYFNCRQDGVCPPPEITGYTVSQTVLVKVRDFAKVGDLMSGVVQNGANQVSDLRFTVDDPTALENQARAEAIQKAKAKAREVAKAGGFKLGDLLSIEEGGVPTPYYSYGMGGGLEAKGMGDDVVAPAIEAGSQEIVVTVNLRYEID
ncbi:MAG: SIMPL domain-containing protein [Patescibacteria group bacterium]